MTPIPHDSYHRHNLNHLGFRCFAPHPYLQPWVQCYWTIESEQQVISEETLYPDGGSSLIMDFTSVALPLHFKANQQLTKLQIDGKLDRIGIRFHPGGAFQLLGFDMSEFAKPKINAQGLTLDRPQLQEQLSIAATQQQRLSLIDAWLLQAANQANAKVDLIQHLLPRLFKSQTSIQSLSRQYALSQRQLERKFRQQVGLSAVQLKQLIRIKYARKLIHQNLESPLTQIALTAGFYDQAHFIRQFQQVTGQTPGQYKQRKMSQKYNATL